MRIFIAPRGFDCRGCCHILCKSLVVIFLPGVRWRTLVLYYTRIQLVVSFLYYQVSLWKNNIPLFYTLCAKRMGSKHFVGPHLNYFFFDCLTLYLVISAESKSDLTIKGLSLVLTMSPDAFMIKVWWNSSHLDHESICWSVCDSRGSHFCVLCRSVCDWDQNWIPKWSKPFWGANQGIKVTSELLKSTIKNTRLQCDLWPLQIKRSRASEGIDQVIKHTFCRSKNLIVGRKSF